MATDPKSYPREDVLVPPGLHVGHLDPQDSLALGRQLFDDIALKPTQHDRLELAVQIADLGLVLLV
jgi:hypothetical protein